MRGQIFTGVVVTEKYGQVFSGELELSNEEGIITGGELFQRGTNAVRAFQAVYCCSLVWIQNLKFRPNEDTMS